MNGMEFRTLSIWIIFVLVQIGWCGDDTPSTMTHAVVQMSGTGIDPSSFAARPKEYWRASNKYCRVDEEADQEHGIHGRLIINEPDVWMVNLADRSARHFVDPGPTFNCKTPIFAFDAETAKSKVGELEFGRELEFFTENKAELITGPKLDFKANYYELLVDDSVLRLVEREDPHAPLLVALKKGDKLLQVKYLLWDSNVPFKIDLFAKPTGVTIQGEK